MSEIRRLIHCVDIKYSGFLKSVLFSMLLRGNAIFNVLAIYNAINIINRNIFTKVGPVLLFVLFIFVPLQESKKIHRWKMFVGLVNISFRVVVQMNN